MTSSVESVLAKGCFDYVVIGGGTAGLNLADNINNSDILRPAWYGKHFSNDDYTYNYELIPQRHADNRGGYWQRGKGLGGSSAINFMCYLKPSAADINDIERLGNPGWTFEHFRAFCESFIPSDDPNRLRDFRETTKTLGTNGPLKISYPPTLSNDDLEFAVIDTFKKNGVPSTADPYNGDPSGVFLTPNTYDPITHTRTYSTTAFYLPHRDRPNFTVLTCAIVGRINTEKDVDGSLTATGVEFFHGGRKHVVNANKEVIVCAGTLKSPQILELSGIGCKEILEKNDIPVKVDLRGVGANVQEHICHALSWELRDDAPYETLDLLRDPETAAKHLKLHATGEGLHTYGMTVFCFASAEIMSPKAVEIYQRAKQHILSNWDSYSPDLQAQYKIEVDRIDRKAAGCESILMRGLSAVTNPPTPGQRYISFVNTSNYLLSRGTIHVTSNDPLKDPEYDPHYTEMEADLDVIVEQVHFSRKMAAPSPMKDIIGRELNPGAEVRTDKEIKDWARSRFSTIWHTSSSCSMMPREIGGVVDTQKKVYGTSNIRVVDLSVLPILVGTHTLSTVFAIAENAAEVIMGKA